MSANIVHENNISRDFRRQNVHHWLCKQAPYHCHVLLLLLQFPVNFAEMNRAYIWQQWLQELICDFTATK